MKKLLIIACLLPFASSAQTIIKDIFLPNIPVDKITRLRTYTISEPVEGAKKDKLAPVLNKWFASNFKTSGNPMAKADSDIIKMNGEGSSQGSYAPKHLTPFQSAPDKLTVNESAIDYKINFTVQIVVTDGKYNIVLSSFKIEVFNVTTPLEQYYTRDFPHIIIPEEHSDMDISEMYSYIFEDMNFDLQRVMASASKYVAKAKKKGDI
jgi:hypothetical protein